MVKQEKRLFKGAALALSLLLLLGSLAGCGGKPQEDVSSADGPTNTYTPPVNEDGYIAVTIPVTLMGGSSAEEVIPEFQNSAQYDHKGEMAPMERITDVVANEDGSVNYIFRRSNLNHIKRNYMTRVVFNMGLAFIHPFKERSTLRLTLMEYHGQ